MRLTSSKAALAVLDVLVWDCTAPVYASVLSEATGLPVGTVAVVLAQAERKGWVSSAWDDVDPAETGRPRRRLYALTTEGDQRARRTLDDAIGRLDRQEVETVPVQTWPKQRVDDHLLAAIVHLLPRPVRGRFDEEFGGEFAASRHPIADAVSVLGNVFALRRALRTAQMHVPWRCRLGRHVDIRVRTDEANHRAYFLRCRRCLRERNPGQDPVFNSSNRRGWASVTAG